MLRTLKPFVFLAALLVLDGAARPASACPADSISLGGYGTLVTTAARLDSARTDYGTFRAYYDLAVGSLGIEQCCNLSLTFVDVADEFDVVGVSPGTPVACSVELAVDGTIQTPGGVLFATLEHAGSTDQRTYTTYQYLGWLPVSDQLALPLTIVAGTPERVRFALAGRRTVGSDIGASGSRAGGTIRFTGLPPGVSVVSCQGYPGGAVPTRTSSWGRLKAIYR